MTEKDKLYLEELHKEVFGDMIFLTKDESKKVSEAIEAMSVDTGINVMNLFEKENKNE